jgi:hypothetical protein
LQSSFKFAQGLEIFKITRHRQLASASILYIIGAGRKNFNGVFPTDAAKERALVIATIKEYRYFMNGGTERSGEAKLELARRAFNEFFPLCFWFCDPKLVIEEKHIPMIVRHLRLNGGHKGYRKAAQLCR